MEYLLLTIAVVGVFAQNIFIKQYNAVTRAANSILFAALSALSAMVFFIAASGFNIAFHPGILAYSFLFAAGYSLSQIGLNGAIAKGPLSISSLISSYSLILPTLYGIFFLHDAVSYKTCIGIFLLLLSLFLINVKKEEKKVCGIWWIYIGMAFVGGGMCPIAQKMQQTAFEGAYKSEFMVTALLIVVVVLLPISLKDEKKCLLRIRESLPLALANGMANGIVNLLIMILLAVLPNSVLYPMVSAGSISLMFAAAIIVYKEKLSRIQIVGYIIGVAAIVFLNL